MCAYDLCLKCYQDIRDLKMKVEESTFVWKANADENILCPKMHIKGGDGTL